MATADRELAAFVAGFDLADLPESVTDHAGLVIADTVGAIVGGSTEAAVSDYARMRADGPDGTASVLGTELRTSVAGAADCNGTAGVVLELDEGHKRSAGHPSIHVLPAVLSAAEADGGSGSALLEAFVVGYEVATRVGIATSPLRSIYHMHGVWPIVGGAAAVARYRGLDADTTRHAMGIAAGDALHTVFDAAIEGATERNAYAGSANASAIRAVDRAQAGFTAVEDGLRRHLERASEDGFDADALVDGLGTRWDVERGYFKRHAACRYTHGALDAIDRVDDGIDPESIESVRVETYPTAARLSEPRPENALQAKFSIPFAVATRLVNGHSRKWAFEEGRLTPETFALADRVTVASAADLAARVPDARSTRVRVRFADGSTIEEEVEHARGDATDPYSAAELEAKFHELVEPVLPGRAKSAWEAFRDPAGQSVAELLAHVTA